MPHKGDGMGGGGLSPPLEVTEETAEAFGEAATVTEAFPQPLITLPYSDGGEGIQGCVAGGFVFAYVICSTLVGHPLRAGLGVHTISDLDVAVKDGGTR